MKIAVVGPGAIGSLFGGRLAQAGHAVWLIHHRPEHVRALLAGGLTVEDDRTVARTTVRATTDAQMVGCVDLAIVLVKAPQTPLAARACLPLLGEGTVVLTLQNGLGQREILADVVGPERVLMGITYTTAVLKAPGHVHYTAPGDTFLGGGHGRATARAERIARAFSEAGLPTSVTDRLEEMVWGKLVINAALNATCALTGADGEILLAAPEARRWLGLVADEVATVAAARGVRLPYPDATERVLQHCAVIGLSKPSMLQDVERGRSTEIDAINGAIVREAERMGIAAPYNRALTLLVKTLEARQGTRLSSRSAGA